MKKALAAFIEGRQSAGPLPSADKETIKQSIVMKLLFLLGWDIFDPSEVKPNYVIGNHRIDCCLISKTRPKIFIQVLAENRTWVPIQQTLDRISLKLRIDYFIITDGSKWYFYIPYDQEASTPNCFCSFDFSSDDVLAIVNYFVDFLDAGTVSVGQSLQSAQDVLIKKQQQAVHDALPGVWRRLLAEPHGDLVRLLCESAEKACSIRVHPDAVVSFLTEYAHQEMDPPPPASQEDFRPVQRILTAQSISCFSFLNKVYPVKSWGEVIARLCEVLKNEHRKNIDKLLWHSVGGKYYFNKNKDELRFAQRIDDTDIYAETHLSPRRNY